MASRNTVVRRIDPELDDLIIETSEKGGIPKPVASRKLARILRGNLKGKKVKFKENTVEEIIF